MQSIFKTISKEEYEGAADPTYSYFPIVSPGKNSETGESEEQIFGYAKHKYVEDE